MAPKQRAKQLEQLAATLRAGEVEMPPPSEVPVKRQRLKGGGANGKENTPEEPPANPTEVEEEPEKPKKETKKKKKKTEDTKTEVTNTTDTGNGSEPAAPNGSEPAAPKQKRPLEETADAEVPKAKAKAKTAPRAKAKSKMNEAPDFEVCWENHAKLMAFYDLTEEEATTCLLSVVGEDEAGRKFWGKFRTNKDTPKNDNEHPMGPGKPISRAERELLEDSQLPEYEHEDTDLDSNLDGSGSSMDQLETQLAEEFEKVLPTPTPTPPPPVPVSQVWCFKSI